MALLDSLGIAHSLGDDDGREVGSAGDALSARDAHASEVMRSGEAKSNEAVAPQVGVSWPSAGEA